MHAYLLMKRLYVDWPNIEQEMRNDEWRSNKVVCTIHSLWFLIVFLTYWGATERLDKIIVGARFPKEEDFFEAAQTLVRLQDTYELNLTELANGTLCGRQTYAGKSITMLFQLSFITLKNKSLVPKTAFTWASTLLMLALTLEPSSGSNSLTF